MLRRIEATNVGQRLYLFTLAGTAGDGIMYRMRDPRKRNRIDCKIFGQME